ncbi:MAG: alpha/beta hydrolase family protein [Oscillospiraceae bacterium]|nr:alpha/beta hydrolase family protein [Oscillospiraceae bacterium]
MALMQVNFFSDVLGMETQMNVILPQQTSGQIGVKNSDTCGRIPTLYLLHGMSDDHSTWLRRTSIERYAEDLGIAVVMPTTHLGWYTDMNVGNRYWTYISEELPRICRSFFKDLSDRREETFAAGLSMGGYGAMKLGLGASDTFGAVASLSGGLDAIAVARGDLGGGRFWWSIFGDEEQVTGSDNDLFALATRLKESGKPLPKIYMWCGTEDFLYDHNIRMRDHLKGLGYDLTYEECPGDHQWKYWDQKIQNVLDWLPIEKK